MGIKHHELSACHREAVEAIIKIPATTKPIGVHLSQEYAAEQAKRRKALLKIMSNIRFLARQSLPLRGHGNDEDGNLYQLLTLYRP